MSQIRRMIKQFEWCQSNDCLIVCNQPLKTDDSYHRNVAEFFQSMLNNQIEASDLKGFHTLERGSPDNPFPIIVKLIYFTHKEWT